MKKSVLILCIFQFFVVGYAVSSDDFSLKSLYLASALDLNKIGQDEKSVNKMTYQDIEPKITKKFLFDLIKLSDSTKDDRGIPRGYLTLNTIEKIKCIPCDSEGNIILNNFDLFTNIEECKNNSKKFFPIESGDRLFLIVLSNSYGYKYNISNDKMYDLYLLMWRFTSELNDYYKNKLVEGNKNNNSSLTRVQETIKYWNEGAPKHNKKYYGEFTPSFLSFANDYNVFLENCYNEKMRIIEEQKTGKKKAEKEEELRKIQNEREREKEKERNNLIIGIIVLSGIPLAYIIWDKFIRRRCPNCKSKHYKLISEEEIDRWRGTKQVSERTSTGKTKTRHVQTTFIKMKRDYQCIDCNNEWEEITKEEL